MSDIERKVLWMIVVYLIFDAVGRWWDWWHETKQLQAITEFMRLENQAYNADIQRWADTYKRLDNLEYQIGEMKQ